MRIFLTGLMKNANPFVKKYVHFDNLVYLNAVIEPVFFRATGLLRTFCITCLMWFSSSMTPLNLIYAKNIIPPICLNADKIFINATFITMNPHQPQANAVAVSRERIVAVGQQKPLLADCKGAKTQIIDLQGNTVTPGFIDTYAPFVLYGWLANHSLDLSTTNVFQRRQWKPVKTTAAFLAAIQKKDNSEKDWLIVSGYDESRLKGTPLTQAMLDDLDIKKPLIVFYASSQKALLNDLAIKKLQPIKSIKPIQVDYHGVVSGASFEKLLDVLITPSEASRAIETAASHYARQGYTTVTEVLGQKRWIEAYDQLTAHDSFPLDIIYSISNLKTQLQRDKITKKNPRIFAGPLIVKIDGLTQNYAAFLTAPYYQAPLLLGKNWHGALIHPSKTTKALIHKAMKSSMPVAIEAHGDAAIDFSLDVLSQSSQNKTGTTLPPVFINIEYIRPNQLQRFKDMGIKTSWLSPYLFYWGEDMCHSRLGPERAFEINPLHSAQKILGGASTHINPTAAPPSPIDAIYWMTTRIVQRWNLPENRRCPQYFNIAERITPSDALASFTIQAAKLYQLEQIKGSIEVGKLADMTLLNANPLSTNGDKCQVEGTVLRGVLHWASKKH